MGCTGERVFDADEVWKRSMIALLLTLGAVSFSAYNCTIVRPHRMIGVLQSRKIATGKFFKFRKLRLPRQTPDDWKFVLQLTQDSSAEIISIARDPLGIAGKHERTTAGDGKFRLAPPFGSDKIGNCILTNAGCWSTFDFFTQPDKSLRFELVTSPVVELFSGQTPEPDSAIAPGHCIAIGNAK